MHWSRCLLILALSWIFFAAAPARRPARPAQPPAPDPADSTAQPSADPTHVKLPASIESVTVAKGGQYLVLHLGKLRQLAIFDVNDSKVIKYLPMKSDDIVVAGSADKLFIGHRSLRLIERIDLGKMASELTVAAPEGGIAQIAAGANADGPVMLLAEQGAKRCWLLDPVTLKAEDFPSEHWGGHGGGAWGPVTIHISFDGSRTVANGGGWAGIEACDIVNGKIAHVDSGSYANGETLIAGDGQLVFLPDSGILQSDLASQVKGIEGTAIPADNPDYSLAFRKDKKDAILTLFANADPRPLVMLRDFPELAENSKLPLWQRVHLAPQLKSLVTVGRGGDELLVRKFDLVEQLNAGGIDYLFVDSNPVKTAQRGAKYTYAVNVVSKRGGVKMELQGGPPGMTLSADGKLAWQIPANFADADPVVIINITDASGQAIFHTFNIRLGPLASPLVAKTTPATPARPAPRPVVPNRHPAPAVPFPTAGTPIDISITCAQLDAKAPAPGPPADPDAIERTEYQNRPKPLLKNLTSATAMMVNIAPDGDFLGLTSDIIATVDPDSRRSDAAGIGILRADGDEAMKTALEEAVRAVRLRYPIWAPGHINLSFGEKFVAHGGPSAGTAFGLLMLSTLEGFDLDPKCAVTGDITVDWKVRPVGGVTAKIHGATLDRCLYAAIPAENENSLADMPLLYNDSALWDIQVFSIATLQDAEAIARKDRPQKLAEAIKLFAALQPQLGRADKLPLQQPEIQKALAHILELAPNHLSAKSLLNLAQGKAPKTLSVNATLYRMDVIMFPYYRALQSREKLDRTILPASVTVNARKQFAALRPIAHKDLLPLLADESAFIESMEEFARNPNAAYLDAINSRAAAIDARFDELAGDKDLLDRIRREGY